VQAGYRSLTLSTPPNPTTVPPEIASYVDEAFFEAAFEGVTEAPVPATAPGQLQGYLEDCSPDRIAGWALDSAGGPVRVSIMLGRMKLAELLADSWRADLSEAAIGTGHHGFEFRPTPPIARDLLGDVRVFRVGDKAELPRTSELEHQ